MRTNILKADLANWFNHLAASWPHTLRRLVHILSRRLTGNGRLLLPAPPQPEEPFYPLALRSPDLYTPVPGGGVRLVRFVKLEREMEDADILRNLAERGCQPASPEELESTLKYRREECPNGRLVALGMGRDTEVYWKQGKLLNHHHWFHPKHFAGDFIAALVS